MTRYKMKDTYIRMFLLTCLLRGMTQRSCSRNIKTSVSTHMPLARHDVNMDAVDRPSRVSTHMPLARHDGKALLIAS